MNHGQFVYDALPLGSVRLLQVIPRKLDGLLACRITSRALPAGYQALSYEWSRPGLSQMVSERIYLVDESDQRSGVLTVGRNLYSFLERQTNADADTFWWIDAICINQSDTVEKSVQVQNMGMVYAGAQRVVIWLGEQGSIQHLFPTLDTKVRDIKQRYCRFRSSGFLSKSMQDIIGLTAYDGLLDLYAHSYWTRLWIIQEVFLAKDITVLCGGRHLSWKVLGQVLEYFEAARPLVDNARHERSTDFPSNRFSNLYWGQHKLLTKEANPLDFPALLRLAEPAGCSDPRDKVYGLLSLSPAEASDFRVDYTEDVYGLFFRTCEHFSTHPFSERLQHAKLLLDLLKIDVGTFRSSDKLGMQELTIDNVELQVMERSSMDTTTSTRDLAKCPNRSCWNKYDIPELGDDSPVYVWCVPSNTLIGQHFISSTYHVLFTPSLHCSRRVLRPRRRRARAEILAQKQNRGDTSESLEGWGWVQDEPLSFSSYTLHRTTLHGCDEKRLRARRSIRRSDGGVVVVVNLPFRMFVELLEHISSSKQTSR